MRGVTRRGETQSTMGTMNEARTEASGREHIDDGGGGGVLATVARAAKACWEDGADDGDEDDHTRTTTNGEDAGGVDSGGEGGGAHGRRGVEDVGDDGDVDDSVEGAGSLTVVQGRRSAKMAQPVWSRRCGGWIRGKWR